MRRTGHQTDDRRPAVLRLGAGTLAIGTALLVAAGTAPAASGAGTRTGSSAGAAAGQVVAHPDVDGDGRPDTVLLSRTGADGAPHGAVLVTVHTAAGRTATYRLRTRYWSGDPWAGATRLDRRPGEELVVGREQGANARLFAVLTWRHGALVRLPAPGYTTWLVDGAYDHVFGWQHKPGDPPGLVRRRAAERHGRTNRFDARVTTFRIEHGTWTKLRTVHKTVSQQRAFRWGAWRVPGLAPH